MKGLPAETDFVVIGAGVAGLRAAIELAAAGRVLVLAKKEVPNFKPTMRRAIAAWLSDEDEIILHLQDTLDAGRWPVQSGGGEDSAGGRRRSASMN